MIWSIDRIRCDAWGSFGNVAFIEASNWTSDECSFQLVINSNEESVLLDFKITLGSNAPDLMLDIYGIERSLVPDAEEILNNWTKEIERLITFLPKGIWRKGPGQTYQFEYAVLSLLFERLSEFGGHKTTQQIARLLEIEISTAKERVRECRNRNLLTPPGKGIRGFSNVTRRGMKLLEEKEVVNAKKNK